MREPAPSWSDADRLIRVTIEDCEAYRVVRQRKDDRGGTIRRNGAPRSEGGSQPGEPAHVAELCFDEAFLKETDDLLVHLGGKPDLLPG